MGKKVQDLVKGIVITGTAIGGASVFSNTGMAYVHAYTSNGTEETYEVTGGGGESQEGPAENSSTENTYEGSGGTEGQGQESAGGTGEGGTGEGGAPAAEGQEGAGTEGAEGQEGAGTEGAEGQEGSAEGTEGAGAPAAEGQEGSGTEGTVGQEGSVEGAGEGTDVPGTPAVTNENQEGEPEDTPVITASKVQTRSLGATRGMAKLAAAPAQQTPDPATPDPAAQNPAAPAASEMTEEEIASASASISGEESLLKSTSESTSASQTQASDSLSVAESENASEYEATSETYRDNGYANIGVAELQQKVEDLKALEVSTREAIAQWSNPSLSMSNYYTVCARPLAEAMVQYKLVVEGKILYANVQNGNIHMEWKGSNYGEKRLEVRYFDVDGNFVEEYYDYVTMENVIDPETGKVIDTQSIFQGQYVDHNGKQIQREDYAPYVSGINVLMKDYTTTTNKNGFEVFTNYVKSLNPDGTPNEVIPEVKGQKYKINYNKDADNKVIKGIDYYKEFVYHSQASDRDSMSASMTKLNSIAASLSEDAVNFSGSVKGSTSGFVTISQSLSALGSQLYKTSTSASTAKQESLSASTSTSESAASASASASTSESEANSTSTASSESSSLSASESASVAASVSAKSSGSASVSASVSDSESTLGSESIAISNVASDYRADVTNSINTENAVRDNYTDNAVLRPIDNNERVPLAVLDDFVGGEDLGTIPDNVDVITGIEDGDVAKYGQMGPNNWAGTSLPVIGGVAGFFAAAKLRREEKKNKK